MLLDGVERVLRSLSARTGWFLLVLHLSRIAPPGPRAHHRRVAAAVLDDTAARNDGQLFGLCNGDMALLFRPPDDGTGVSGLIARLFQADVPDLDALRTLWPLPAAADQARAYIHARLADSEPSPPMIEASASATASAAALLQTASINELLIRHTAIHLRPSRNDRIVPLFHTVSVSAAAVEARIRAAGPTVDAALLGHVVARFDQMMLHTLPDDVGAPDDKAGLHLRLTLGGVLSEAFAEFATSRAPGHRPVDVEVPFIEMVADPKGGLLARERLRLAGMRLVVSGLTDQILLASRPAVLEPHFMLLDWRPGISAEPGLASAVDRCGRERLVLSQCADEAALTWGLALGIQRFQGRFVDMLLAAARLRACDQAHGCTLRQCQARSAAIGSTIRGDCRNPPLLDRGLPAVGRR